jgi:hypothetical protein
VSRGSDPLERLVSIVENASGDDVRATNFVRGLVLGALVGAAVAGSTIWQRRHGRSIKPPASLVPALPGSSESTTDEPPPTRA